MQDLTPEKPIIQTVKNELSLKCFRLDFLLNKPQINAAALRPSLAGFLNSRLEVHLVVLHFVTTGRLMVSSLKRVDKRDVSLPVPPTSDHASKSQSKKSFLVEIANHTILQ